MGLFKSDTVPIFWDIAVAYNRIAGDQIVEILQNNPHKIRHAYGLEGVKGRSNGFLDELRCYASISSLAEVGLPLIDGDSSESERIMKAGTYEWGTARFELEVFRRVEGSAEWVECGVAALKNAGGFRYRIHRLLDLITDNIGAQVGEWGRIGVRVRSVGYGYPQSYDRITFTGNWKQEFTWVQEHPTYVVINQYGNSPTPTSTPTPTPPPVPTLTLSLGAGVTSVVANNDGRITLNIENIPTGTQLTGSWFKAGIDTGVTELVTVGTAPILLSTLKLREKLSGNYSLRLFYNDNGYSSNAVAVTVNPEVEIAPSVADTVSTANLTITGKYFPVTNITYSYNWLRAGTVVFTSSGGVQSTTVTNNTWTLTLPTSQLQNSTSGDHTFRINIVENNVSIPYNSKNSVTLTVSTPPSITLSPASTNLYFAPPGWFTIKLDRFTAGEVLTTVFQKDGIDLTSTAENRTYTPTNNSMSYTRPFESVYTNGAYGMYRLKVTRPNGTVLFSNTSNVHYQVQSGGEG